mgnify:CR=1 FL=1
MSKNIFIFLSYPKNPVFPEIWVLNDTPKGKNRGTGGTKGKKEGKKKKGDPPPQPGPHIYGLDLFLWPHPESLGSSPALLPPRPVPGRSGKPYLFLLNI